MRRKTVCIFCGANPGDSELITREAGKLCDLLTANEFDLVYGGGISGLMGLIAEKFLSEERKVTGVRPKKLIADEDAHHGLSELIIVDDMFERKSKMMELSDIFISLPGGVGTLDEMLEVYTQTKIGFNDQLSLVLNTNNYYSGLQLLFDQMIEDKFLKPEDRSKIEFHANSEQLSAKALEAASSSDCIDKLAFIALRDRKVLTARSKGKDKFYIPGGKREVDESDDEALVREVKEELDVSIKPGSSVYIGTFRAQADGQQKGIDVKMTCYTADYEGQLTPKNEIDELAWLDSKGFDKIAAVDKKIFRYLVNQGLLL